MSPAQDRVSSDKSDKIVARIAEAVHDPLAALALDLEAVELTPGGKRRVLRIAVDKDGGVTLDDIADATRAVSEVLDDSDVLGETAYTLEVTSRGVDRPLSEPRHWRRNHDRLVKVTLADGEPVTGRVGASDDAGATLDVSGRPVHIAYADVTKALVQIEFSRKPDPKPDTQPDDQPDDRPDDRPDTEES